MQGKCSERLWIIGRWTGKVEIRNKFLTAGEAYIGVFWPTLGFKFEGSLRQFWVVNRGELAADSPWCSLHHRWHHPPAAHYHKWHIITLCGAGLTYLNPGNWLSCQMWQTRWCSWLTSVRSNNSEQGLSPWTSCIINPGKWLSCQMWQTRWCSRLTSVRSNKAYLLEHHASLFLWIESTASERIMCIK